MVGIESGRSRFQAFEALNHQAGTDQEHQRKRDLRNNQHALQARAAAPYR